MKGLAGRRIAFATRHGKEVAIAPALAPLGLELVVADVDTDAFGTFTGDVPRRGDMLETAIAKARAGMAATGLDLGLASEGAYGGAFGGLASTARELLVLVDARDERVVHLSRSGVAANQGVLVVDAVAAIGDFPERVGFPDQGLVVFVETGPGEAPAIEAKGLVDRARLEGAVERAVARSPRSRARIETDLRAHMNPQRMDAIAGLASALAERLATACPDCGAWGYGVIDALRGLPCDDCGAPTGLVRALLHGCDRCGRRAEQPRDDGLEGADAQWCPRCNP